MQYKTSESITSVCYCWESLSMRFTKRTLSDNQLVTMFATILNCTSEEIEVDNTYKMNEISRSKTLISRPKMR